MDKLTFTEMKDGFLERRLPFADDLYPLIHRNPVTAQRSFINLVKQALALFEESYVIKMNKQISVGNDNYTFSDNYDAYVAGTISESSVELVPLAIHTVQKGYYATTSNFWDYSPPKLMISSGDYLVRGFCKYRVWVRFADDGLLTEDSHVYGFDILNLYKFFNQLDLVLLRSIRSRTHLINLPANIDFLQFDEDISFLADQVEKDKNTSADIFQAWR